MRKIRELEHTREGLHKLAFATTNDQSLDLYYRKHGTLYYLPVKGSDLYLVVSEHKLNKNPMQQGYSLWLAKYHRLTDVGRKAPVSRECIVQNFRLPENQGTIEKYCSEMIG